MQKLTLTRISRNDRVSKNNKPFVSVGIQTQEYPNKWINGFGSKDNENWQSGDVVEIDKVYESDQKDTNGNPYLNFEMPKPPTPMQMYGMLKRLNDRLLVLENKPKEASQSTTIPKPTPTYQQEPTIPPVINPHGNTAVNNDDGGSDLPF